MLDTMQVQNYFATKEKEHKKILIAPKQTLLIIWRPTSQDEYLNLGYLNFSPVNEGHGIYFLHPKKLDNPKINWFQIPSYANTNCNFLETG